MIPHLTDWRPLYALAFLVFAAAFYAQAGAFK